MFVKSILDDAGYIHIWISQCICSKNILMQGLEINTFSHGMHTLTTRPKLQIINYLNIRNIYHNFGEKILVSFNTV